MDGASEYVFNEYLQMALVKGLLCVAICGVSSKDGA